MGFDQEHYVPILKAKAGELRALKEAPDYVRNAITPVLELMDVSPKYIEGERDPVPSKSNEAHVQAVAQNIAKSWGPDRSVFIDGYYMEEMDTLEDGREPIGAVMDHLREENAKAIPVTGLDRYNEYNTAIKKAIEQDGRGVCLRLQESDLESDDLDKQLKTMLERFGIVVNKVDLLIDYGHVLPPRSTLVPLVNAIPDLKQWRTVTLAACSFPVNMTGIAQYTTVELPRSEWENWTHLRSRSNGLGRIPTFADYAINHPELSEIDPREMRMSANIRYTWTMTYVVARGEALPRKRDKDRKRPSSEQYPLLAESIISHKAWCGQKFSWGDEYIQKCANKECVGGGREWRAVGTSHHLAFVVKQIANLP